MGLFSRFKRVLKAKISKGLNKLEDPVEQLDYAYEQLTGEQKKIQKAIRDVTADKNLIEQKISESKEKREETHRQAKKYRKKALELEEKMDSYDPEEREKAKKRSKQYNQAARKRLQQYKELSEKVENLKNKLHKSEKWLKSIKEKKVDVRAKLEQVKEEKESLKSEWRMAKAESRIESTLSGLGKEVGDIDVTLSRVRDKIHKKKAQASASREISSEEPLSTPALESPEELELEEELPTGLLEEKFEELDRELKEDKEKGPFLLVAVTGGGTWAVPAEKEEEFKKRLDQIDEQITQAFRSEDLKEKEFNRLYSQIFNYLEKDTLLVGRDVEMEEVSGDSEVIPEPKVKLPPRDLELEEAKKVLEGKDLISEWYEEPSDGS